MRRFKCKNCQKLVKGICLIFNRARSTGKKRDCEYFVQKYVEKKPFRIIPYIPWRSKEDKRKDRIRKEFDQQRVKEMEKLIDQEKLKEVVTTKSIYDKGEVIKIKKNIFKEIFQKICSLLLFWHH